MPTFSMDDLRQSVDGNDTVSIPYRSEKKIGKGLTMGETPRRSMAETKQLVKDSIFAAGSPLKFRELARLIGRSPTPHLRAILNDMIESGELIKSTDTAVSGNMDRFWYGLPKRGKR